MTPSAAFLFSSLPRLDDAKAGPTGFGISVHSAKPSAAGLRYNRAADLLNAASSVVNVVNLILLIIHIAAGSIALLTAALALAAPKGQRWHILAGRVYAVAMTVIFLTAVPLAILGASIFLLLIAVFSFYLVFAGWRFARNRRRRAHPVDWAAVSILGATGLAMWGYAVVIALNGSSQWVTLLIFGAIAVALGLADARFHRRQPGGALRVARHLTNMLAATIATVTAVTVVNVDLEPVWLPWILPTVIITPLIVWWNIRVRRQARRRR